MSNESNENAPYGAPTNNPVSTPTPTPTDTPRLGVQSVDEEQKLQVSSVLGVVEALTELERAEYFACAEVVGAGWNTVVQVGLALATIREKRLYREEFNNFEDYCRQKWEYGRDYVDLLISGAQVFNLLLTNCQHLKPDHESQVRPLVGYSPSDAIRAWERAVEIANGRRITARMVKSAVHALGLKPLIELPKPMKRQSHREVVKLIEGSVGQLLVLLSQKAAYDVLVKRVEVLHGQIRALIPKPTRKPSS